MSDTYLEEVKSALNKDEKRLGQVWRLSEKGLNAKKIAEKLNVKTHGFVYNARRDIKAIVDGFVPTSEGSAKACGRGLKGFAKRHRDSFSSTTFSKLQETIDKCDCSAADSTKREEEEPKLKSQTSAAEQKQQAEAKADASPAERDESPMGESADWRKHLLNTLLEITPLAFERLCKRLLEKSGFTPVELTDGPGDEGIDGRAVISLAGLANVTVLFQCKRYAGSISPRIVRDFRGAIGGSAEKGIIFTTGRFSENAQVEAQKPGTTPIDLIDGELLIDKIKQLDLGVSTKTKRVEVEVVEVDKDWFTSL